MSEISIKAINLCRSASEKIPHSGNLYGSAVAPDLFGVAVTH